jgi:hypothetical protein
MGSANAQAVQPPAGLLARGPRAGDMLQRDLKPALERPEPVGSRDPDDQFLAGYFDRCAHG